MRVQNGRTNLELHELQPGRGPGLLLLHELYGRAADWSSREIAWPGPVFALDFSGHGESDFVRGGAYFCELLVADADCALAHCDATAVAGAGLGAYVALLLSGARRHSVRAALLLPGRGLAGGCAEPRFHDPPPLVEADTARSDGADPRLDYFDRDIRPAEYASAFAATANRLLLCEDGTERPPWWQAVRSVNGSVVVRGGIEQGLAELRKQYEQG